MDDSKQLENSDDDNKNEVYRSGKFESFTMLIGKKTGRPSVYVPKSLPKN